MSTKRVKITFHSVNAGKYTTISNQDLSASSQRIRTEMKDVVREYEKNETESLRAASELILNA